MAPLRVDHDAGRTAFLEALGTLTGVAVGLDDSQLLATSYCRGWSVADVLLHVHLGLQEMMLGIVARTASPPDTDAATYWRSFPPTNDPGADEVDQVRFVRLVSSAYRRPTGLVNHLRATADGVAVAAGTLAPGAVRFQGRVMGTGDFLTTWAVELAVHHLDLRRELDLPLPPPDALRVTRRTVEAIAEAPLPARWPDETAALLGTGRVPLSAGERAEAGAVADRLPVFG